MINDTENFKKRLIYRSQYRGTKEMDKLIGSFVQANINKFNNIQLLELEKFLNQGKFSTLDVKGLKFNPFFNKWKKSDDLSVNYIICSVKN